MTHTGRMYVKSQGRVAILAMLCALASSHARAAELSVQISDPAGRPVRDAVVTFTPASGMAISEAAHRGAYVMAQKNVHFSPFVLAVPLGATVSFPNRDQVSHHVFSFSPAQPFQLPLYGPGETRSVRFTHEGTIALGCNIHDTMVAYIRVVATPYFATTGDDGRVVLHDIPPGSGALRVWQPLMDAPNHETARTVTIAGGEASETFAVRVHPMAPMAGMY